VQTAVEQVLFKIIFFLQWCAKGWQWNNRRNEFLPDLLVLKKLTGLAISSSRILSIKGLLTTGKL
jgi:hypothetical protein